MIATILKALREQLKESDQLHSVEEIARPAPEIPLEYDQILKEGGKFLDDVNGYLPEDVVLAARREEIVWAHSEGVHEIVPMQECRDAGMKPSTSSASFSIVLCNATSRSVEGACLNHDVGEFVKQRETIAV